MNQNEENLANAWDDVNSAIDRVCTSLPLQLGESVKALENAREGMRKALKDLLVANRRSSPATGKGLASEYSLDMTEGDLREWAAKATLELGLLAKAAKDAPKYAVHDWAYEDKGVEKYARTPERAGRLRDRGVKLTPVYTRSQD